MPFPWDLTILNPGGILPCSHILRLQSTLRNLPILPESGGGGKFDIKSPVFIVTHLFQSGKLLLKFN